MIAYFVDVSHSSYLFCTLTIRFNRVKRLFEFFISLR